MSIWYATREQVRNSLEIAHTSSANSLIDAKLDAASHSIEGFLHRRFYPERRTILKDWPNYQYAPTWQLWLDDNEIISLEECLSGGVDITSDVILRRGDDLAEPPYSYVEVDLGSSSAFSSSPSSFQHSISITGLFGWNDTDTSVVSALLGSSINDSATVVVLNPASGYYPVGVGSIIKIDTERMITRNRRMSAVSGQTLTANLSALQSDEIVSVTDGTAFAIDEIILIDAERMRIDIIAGNNLIVTRAWDGSTLAAHTSGATIYAERTFLVRRGALGTTAADHTGGTAAYAHEFPGLVNELAIAETVVALEQNSSAYARTIGSGSSQREFIGQGLEDVRNRAYIAYARKSRKEAI